MVSLTILVLSGDRKKFTFHPDTTAGRVKEMIWSTWDTGMSPKSAWCSLGTPNGHYPFKNGQKPRFPRIRHISVCYIWGEYYKMMILWRVSYGGCLTLRWA